MENWFKRFLLLVKGSTFSGMSAKSTLRAITHESVPDRGSKTDKAAASRCPPAVCPDHSSQRSVKDKRCHSNAPC